MSLRLTPRRLARTAMGALLAMVAAGCGHQAQPAASQRPAPAVSSAASVGAAPAVNPLTGRPSPHHGPLTAVMVENSEYGRPQYGLASADIVYEAYTENFYYPRFMLLFYGQAPSKVGPVRSARPYFVSWVHAWHAAYVHAGASNPAYGDIARDHIHNLDLDSNAQNLGWRSSQRPAPHNLFTNIAQDMQAAAQQWGNPHPLQPWPFAHTAATGTPKYTRVTLTWNPRNTIERWQWDAAAQGWTRWVDCPECHTGFQQVMGLNSGKPVVASNVVIQYTQESYMPDPAHTGWIQIDTTGSGPALLLLGSRVVQGTWRSTGPGQPTRFYLPTGAPATFQPGHTWIEVVPGKGSAVNPFHLQLQSPTGSGTQA